MFLVKSIDLKKHRGEYLNGVVRKKGIKIKVLTELAGYDRSTFYNHIKDPNLPYTILAKYGKIMHHDFALDYPELAINTPVDPTAITTFEEMEKDRDRWKIKYEALSELLNNYLDDRDKRLFGK